MKHYKLGAFLTLSLLALMVAAPAFAEDARPRRGEGMPLEATASTSVKVRMEERRGPAEAQKIEFRNSLDMKKQAVASRTAEFKKETALRHASTTARVLSATVERLEKIVVRIESRIAKVETNGGAVTDAKNAIAAAKVNLATAKTDIKALYSVNLTGEKAQDNYEIVKDAARKVKDSIRAAHENLMKAVRSLNQSVLSEKERDSQED